MQGQRMLAPLILDTLRGASIDGSNCPSSCSHLLPAGPSDFLQKPRKLLGTNGYPYVQSLPLPPVPLPHQRHHVVQTQDLASFPCHGVQRTRFSCSAAFCSKHFRYANFCLISWSQDFLIHLSIGGSHHSWRMEVIGQLKEVRFFLLPQGGPQEFNAGNQSWQQASLPTESYRQPSFLVFLRQPLLHSSG